MYKVQCIERNMQTKTLQSVQRVLCYKAGHLIELSHCLSPLYKGEVHRPPVHGPLVHCILCISGPWTQSKKGGRGVHIVSLPCWGSEINIHSWPVMVSVLLITTCYGNWSHKLLIRSHYMYAPPVDRVVPQVKVGQYKFNIPWVLATNNSNLSGSIPIHLKPGFLPVWMLWMWTFSINWRLDRMLAMSYNRRTLAEKE